MKRKLTLTELLEEHKAELKDITKEELVNFLVKFFLKPEALDLSELDLSELDFSAYDCNVDISKMKVARNLYQDYQLVNGCLFQACQTVNGPLYQGLQRVFGNLDQSHQTVSGDLKQSDQTIAANNLHEFSDIVAEREKVFKTYKKRNVKGVSIDK